MLERVCPNSAHSHPAHKIPINIGAESHLVVLVHLVELVDAADAVVGQHEGAGLHAKLPCAGPNGGMARLKLKC
jgi:hypothetical protein